MWNLYNKTALVTGGNKGIGKAVVTELLQLGAKVVFSGRDTVEIRNLENSFSAAGYVVKGVSGDLNETDVRRALIDTVQDSFGKLDILVNNAGINIRKKSVDYTVCEYKKILDTDLVVPFELCRMCYPMLLKSNAPSIINISSVAASLDDHTGAPYGMAKAGLLQMTRNLAVEWASQGIRVNAVSPWFTRTPLTEGLLKQKDKIAPVLKRTPLQRVAQASEISGIVAFLAMDKSSYITGQNIIVDGGMSVNALMEVS